MTINSNGKQGKTRHLNVRADNYPDIYFDASEPDWLAQPVFCIQADAARLSEALIASGGHILSLGKPNTGMSLAEQQIARFFVARSDVSQLKALCDGEDGEKLAETIRNNCRVWFPLKSAGAEHDA